jgi:hypothetical protein
METFIVSMLVALGFMLGASYGIYATRQEHKRELENSIVNQDSIVIGDGDYRVVAAPEYYSLCDKALKYDGAAMHLEFLNRYNDM